MKRSQKNLRLFLALAVLGALASAFWTNSGDLVAQTAGRKVLFYQDSMHPWIKSDHAGKCTICGMDLTPIYEGQPGFDVGKNLVVLSSNSITVLNVQTEEVKRRALRRSLQVAGTLEPNEARKAIIAAPTPGRIQATTVEFTGVEVEKGQMLVTLFSPELVQKRSYLRSVGADQSSVGQGLVQSAAGANPYLGNIVAPLSGVVVERNVYQGQYVVEGEKLFTLVDASVLWFRFDAYEQQLSWLEPGQTIQVTATAVPGKKFPAVIAFIEPTLNEATRTVKVRADIKNPVVATNGQPHRLLRFGMYAEGRVQTEIPDVLAVPRSAILFPGAAAYAYVCKAAGVYERRRVKLGRQGDELWEVQRGLAAGDRVVTSGNVLIDAQAQFNQGSKPDDAGADEMASGEPEAGAEGATAPMSHSPGAAEPAAMASMPAAGIAPETNATQMSTNKPLTYREADAARRALSAEMRNVRLAAIAEANGAKPADPVTPTAAEAAMPASTPKEMPPGAMMALPPTNSVMGTNTMPPAAASKYPARAGNARNSNVTRGAVRDEMQKLRWALITGAYNTNEAGAAESAAEAKAPVVEVSANIAPAASPAGAAPQASGAEMRPLPTAATAGAQGGMTAKAGTLSMGQNMSLGVCMAVAGGIAQALAADDVAKVNQYATNLPTASAALAKEFPADHRWSALVQKLTAASKWHPAADLADARKQFLPFSTAVVELAKELRKEDPMFAGLKIYHCPMAPKPGLWMQTQGPLRNPFYGSKMLTCGEEIGPTPGANADSMPVSPTPENALPKPPGSSQ